MKIQVMEPPHWEDVRRIYAEGIATGDATFETEPPEWGQWDQGHLQSCRLIILLDDQVVGWAALSPVSSRCVYGGVAEISIYVSSGHRGCGLGGALLGHLIIESEKEGFWTLQAGIFPENEASLRIHEQNGFRRIGVRRNIGNLNGIWRDTVLLERRSAIIGVAMAGSNKE